VSNFPSERVEEKGMTKAGALWLEAADTCLCLFFQRSKFLLLFFKCQEFFSQAPRSIDQSINHPFLQQASQNELLFFYGFFCAPPSSFLWFLLLL
jgi:hypothetical protein